MVWSKCSGGETTCLQTLKIIASARKRGQIGHHGFNPRPQETTNTRPSAVPKKSAPAPINRYSFPRAEIGVETLFIAPFASHRWASARGRSHWVALEGWQDSMAGPLSSITSSGGCDYVYTRDDGYFAGVSDPPKL